MYWVFKELAKRIGEELNIPVFLYEKSATNPSRENLANIRRGQYEGMAEKLKKRKNGNQILGQVP